MTQIELIDRLCAVNTLLTDIVREQAEIIGATWNRSDTRRKTKPQTGLTIYSGSAKGQKTKTMQSKQHFANIFDGGKENDH